MNTLAWVWIIVIVVIILIIIAILLTLGRNRKRQADRRRAGELREEAQNSGLEARAHEAKAARAEADAKQAEVDAERMRREAGERQDVAQSAREHSAEQAQKADAVDPDVATPGRKDVDAHDRTVGAADERPANGPVERDGRHADAPAGPPNDQGPGRSDTSV